MPTYTDCEKNLCADCNGFSLHAAVRRAADDRKTKPSCRYITHPALAYERVQTNATGQVVLNLKTAWRDGTTHPVMSPPEFMQRLAALVNPAECEVICARLRPVRLSWAKLLKRVFDLDLKHCPNCGGV